MKIRRLACSRVTLLEGRPTTQSGVDPPLVVVSGESIQLAMKVEAVPEEELVEILAPKGSDEPLDERMRARHGCGLAMPRSRAGANPAPVTASHGPWYRALQVSRRRDA
jgi:hypothetical protein